MSSAKSLFSPVATRSDVDRVTCRMCQHTVERDDSGHLSTRCPSCKSWLASSMPDEDTQSKGWKKVSTASLFQRFEPAMPQSMHDAVTVPDSTPPLHMAEAPARRELSFDFSQPEVRDPKPRQASPQVLRDEVAKRESVDMSEDDAIEAWLDAAESEPLMSPGEIAAELFMDVSFEAAFDEQGSELIAFDELQVHGEEEEHTLELEREPERFELQLGEKFIGPLDREGVNALIVSGLERTAKIRCEGQEHWSELGSYEAFAPLYALQSAAPGHEIDEPGSATLIIPELDDAEQETLVGGLWSDAEPTPDALAEEPIESPIEELIEEPAKELVEEPDVVLEAPKALLHGAEESKEPLAAPDEIIPELPPGQVARPSKRLWLVMGAGLLLVFVLGSLVGATVMSEQGRVDLSEATTPGEMLETMVMLPRERAERQAVRGAKTVVHLSSAQDFMPRQREVAYELAQSGEHERALRVFGVLWQEPESRTASSAMTYAKSAIHAHRYDVAREVAIAGSLDKEASPEQKKEIAALFNKAIKQDPALHPEVLTLKKDDHIDAARALGGGKSISLKLMKDGAVRYAFKPSQLDWAEGWRAEVAAYLLCEAIGCHFKVPESLPARISREDFNALYGRVNSTKQTTYAEKFKETLLWVKEPGPDGVEREYMYGVVKEWMPGFMDFPIEYRELWRAWLDAGADPSLMDRELRDALSLLRQRQDGRYYREFMKERAEVTTQELARGISDILTFDFLTSNWDRYSGVEIYYGVNNQFDDGEFLSLDNGAAFHILTQKKVKQRFKPVTRFSRSTVSAMRMMQPDAVNDILFPEPRAEARQRLKVFWSQRDKLMTRVDELVRAHDEPSVLYFN